MPDFDIGTSPRTKTDLTTRRGINSIAELDREVIAWDGEGQDLPSVPGHQALTVFGASTGDVLVKADGHLACEDILELIVAVGRDNPTARHVGYFFDYDVNMITRSLRPADRAMLHRTDHLYLRRGDRRFRIEYRPRKWFRVTEYSGPAGRRAPGARSKRSDQRYSVKIEDISSHKGCSFVVAVHEALGCARGDCDYSCVPHLAKVAEGKARRGVAGEWDDLAYIRRYHAIELGMLVDLTDKLRADFDHAGFPAYPLYGPAVLARHWADRHRIRPRSATPRRQAVEGFMDKHTHQIMSPELDPRIYGHTQLSLEQSSAYAYMGGRFELFCAGRIPGPIYCYDINSAYPHAMTMLPSMRGMEWKFVEYGPNDVISWDPHALYQVMFGHNLDGAIDGPSWPNVHAANPLFHRDVHSEVSFPSSVQGWFWGPEVGMALRGPEQRPDMFPASQLGIAAAWVPINAGDQPRPFAQVEELYYLRQQMKAEGHRDELALKLALNSLYGILAQTKGWRPDRGEASIPPFHQIEWAGWITSYVRAQLFETALHCGLDELVAFETDSVMCTRPLPVPMGEVGGLPKLGDWKLTVYDEGFYLQSGMGWFRRADTGEWEVKRRGMDPDTFTLDAVRDHVRHKMGAGTDWAPYQGRETRFITLGMSFPARTVEAAGLGYFDKDHCQWKTRDKLIHLTGAEGSTKRWHSRANCSDCQAGTSAWVKPHRMLSTLHDSRWHTQYPRNIPWRAADWGATLPPDVDDGLAPEET
jgi:DNA polymerase family B